MSEPDIRIVVNKEGYVPIWVLIDQLLDYRAKWPETIDNILSEVNVRRTVYHEDELLNIVGKYAIIGES